MKLDNKELDEMVEAIILTDNELQTIQGGQGCPGSTSPSYNYGGGYPSYNGAYPSGCNGYNPGSNYASYTPGYNASYGSPSDGGGYPDSTVTTYTVTTTTYSVTPVPSGCGGN